MNTIKYMIQVAMIIVAMVIGPACYSSAITWSAHPHFTGTFAPIPIAVTLLSGQQEIEHTGVELFTDSACAVSAGTAFNIGLTNNPFTFASSTTYYLGLSADTYTNIMFGYNARSIQVTVNATGGASGAVCIPMSCASSTSCALTSAGPFLLNI